MLQGELQGDGPAIRVADHVDAPPSGGHDRLDQRDLIRERKWALVRPGWTPSRAIQIDREHAESTDQTVDQGTPLRRRAGAGVDTEYGVTDTRFANVRDAAGRRLHPHLFCSPFTLPDFDRIPWHRTLLFADRPPAARAALLATPGVWAFSATLSWIGVRREAATPLVSVADEHLVLVQAAPSLGHHGQEQTGRYQRAKEHQQRPPHRRLLPWPERARPGPPASPAPNPRVLQ